MGWKIERWMAELYPGHENIFSAYEHLGGRERVIVACAVLDTALAELISLRLFPDDAEVVSFLGANEDGRASVATFGARIQAAYLLGLINRNAVLVLRALKNLRNVMAHRAKADFTTPQAQAALRPLVDDWMKKLAGITSENLNNLRILAEASRTDPEAAEVMVRIQFMVLQVLFRELHPKVERLTPMEGA